MIVVVLTDTYVSTSRGQQARPNTDQARVFGKMSCNVSSQGYFWIQSFIKYIFFLLIQCDDLYMICRLYEI